MCVQRLKNKSAQENLLYNPFKEHIMAEQPANALIKIHRQVRTRHQIGRNASVKEIAQRLADKQVMVPGEEVDIFLKLDGDFKSDAWRFGHPVTVNKRDPLTVSDLYASVADLAMPVQMVGGGQDLFIGKDADNLTDDLFEEVRNAAPAPRGIFEVV